MKKRAFSGIVLLVSLGFLLSLTPVKASDLVQDCTTCGCPAGQYCDVVTKACKAGCSAGFWIDTCSLNKPQYCNLQSQLVDNCLKCGCPVGLECLQAGSCAVPPVLTATVSAEYEYNKIIDIPVRVQGIAYGSDVNAKVTNEAGSTIPPSSFRWVDSSTVVFSFPAVTSPGSYKFQAYYLRSPYPTVWSQEYTFSVKAPLSVTFLVSDPNQYTVRDVELTLTIRSPTGEVVQTVRSLTGTVNGYPIPLHEIYVDKGSGSYSVIIPKADLTPGILELTLTVTDPQMRYQPVTVRVTNIHITMPEVSVSVLAPENGQVGEYKTIGVGTNDVFGKPMDVDSLFLKISYPDGTTFKEVRFDGMNSEFRKKSTGVYETDFTFTEGGAYAFHAVATKSFYSSGANTPDPITVVSGGSPGQSCDVSDQCDPNCPDDADCQQKAGLPWWLWVAGGGIVIFLIAGVVMVRKKK